MKRLITTGLAIALAAAASAPAFAGGKNFHQRLENQQWRIEQGIESGALTRKEAKFLKKEQKELRKITKHLSKDGRLSKRDRHFLDDRFDEASAHIYRLKHNSRHHYHDEHHVVEYGYRDYGRNTWDGRAYIHLSDDRW